MSASKQLLDPPDLARILGVDVTWVYGRTAKKAKDPIPRCKGFGRLKFNPRDEAFREWIARNFGPLDLEVSNE